MPTQEDKVVESANESQAPDAGQPEPQPEELKNLNYEILLLGLSLLSVLNIVLALIFRDPVVDGILDIINTPLTIIFFIDFLIRLRTAESKSRYFFKQFGWADLAASLPFPALKIFRLFRVFRAVRMIRRFGFRNLMRQLSDHRADAALSVIVFAIMVVLEFGGILVTLAERTNPDANIKTSSDAIWWAFVTITTIGYGDRYPTTNLGRFFSLFVMTTGVALFGVLTGYLANAFLAPSKPKEAENEESAEPVDKQETLAYQPAPQETQAMVAELKGLLVAQEKAQAELRALVAELKERQ